MSEYIGIRGDKCELFLRYEETKEFGPSRYSDGFVIHNFVDRHGNQVSLYNVVSRSPVGIRHLEPGDCVKLKGTIVAHREVRFSTLFGEQPEVRKVTRLNRVTILENKGKKAA